jgi:folate-binding protein YgfZ
MSSLQQADHQVTPDAAARAASPEDFVAVLDHLGVLRFIGEDAGRFLQGQLSCDVESVSGHSSSYGAYCSPKGRMLANFLLWREEADFLMALSRELVSTVQRQISKYVLRSKVKIADASGSIVLAGAAGARAGRTLAAMFGELPTKPHEVRTVAAVGTAVKLSDGRLFLALTTPLEGRTELADARIWRWLEIRAGLPLVTAATQDQFVPQMANLELIGGVSFEKGCYTGQEVVARAQHLGKVKRRMFLANVTAPAQPGDALYSDDLGDQASGMVVNAEASPDGGHDLLAVVQAASRERSTVHLKGLDGPALRFLALPYAVA